MNPLGYGPASIRITATSHTIHEADLFSSVTRKQNTPVRFSRAGVFESDFNRYFFWFCKHKRNAYGLQFWHGL